MVCAFVNCAVVLKNASISSFFNGQRWTKCAVNILRSYLNLWQNWQLKSSRRSHTLKGSHSMGDGQIFLKTHCDVSKSPRLRACNGSDKSETSYVYLILHSSLINTKLKFFGLNFEKFCCVIRNWDRNFQI
jgi:hypothetical protein